MKILITGGAGFIGSNFIVHALTHGHKIINVDKLTYAGNLDNLGHFQKHENYTFVKQDICHQESIESYFFEYKPDVVVHMAAESHVDRSIDNAHEFIQTNINGTFSLLASALKYVKSLPTQNNFKFLHLSTDEVFGALGPTGKFSEHSPYQPNSPYAASKASSDLLVRSYVKTFKLPAIIINSSNNYGPRQHPEKLIPLTVMNALEGKNLPIYGSGNQIRDWLYVEDHVDALFKIIEHGHIGASYCIGSDNEIKNLDLVHMICEILNKIKPSAHSYEKLITHVTDRPAHDFRYATDATKLKTDTGWQPKTDFQLGLQKTIHWYMQEQENLKSLQNARVRRGLAQ